MDLPTVARLALIYIHLLLCVFALHEVLVGDWRVLRRRLTGVDVQALHRRVSWLLVGLWVTGLSVIAIDIDCDVVQLAARPKIVAKLVTVLVLSLNGWLLQQWCFPRLTRLESIGAIEMTLVMLAGAVSTASWLMAAFFGVARPLKDLPLAQLMQIYGAALAAAALVAGLLGHVWRRQNAAALARRSLSR